MHVVGEERFLELIILWHYEEALAIKMPCVGVVLSFLRHLFSLAVCAGSDQCIEEAERNNEVGGTNIMHRS